MGRARRMVLWVPSEEDSEGVSGSVFEEGDLHTNRRFRVFFIWSVILGAGSCVLG